MNISLNTVQASANATYISEEALQQAGAEQDLSEVTTPEQPLLGSGVTLEGLWRMVKEFLTIVANATSGTAKEANESKKSLIDLQKQTQIDDLKKRESNLREQQKNNAINKIFSAIIFALTLIVAAVTMVFNPVMGAIMIGTLVASIVIPLVVDKILEACGVDPAIREKVKMGLEIGITLLGAIATLNPLQMIKGVGSAVAAGAKAGVQAVMAGVKSLPSVLANINWAQVSKSIGEAAAKAGTKIVEMVQDLAKAMQTFFKSLASGSRSTASVGKSLADKWQDLKVIVQATIQVVTNAMKTAGSAAAAGLKSALEALKNADEILNSVMAAMREAGQQFVEMMRNLGVYMRAFGHAMKTAPGETLKAAAQEFLDWVVKMATTFDKASAVRVNQVGSVAIGASTAVQTGFSIASSEIAKDTEIAGALNERLITIIKEVLEQLNAAMRTFQQALQSLMTLNSDYRHFIQRQMAASNL